MDVGRQIVRWSIPAAVLVLVLLGAELLLALIFNQTPYGFELVEGVNAAATLVAVVLGLALGFVLYQIYFFAFDSVLPWLPHLVGVPPDRGRDVLAALDEDQIAYIKRTMRLPLRLDDMLAPRRLHPVAGVRLPHDSLRRRLVYRRARDDNWRVVRRLVLEYVGADSLVWSEYESVTDIYHSLGTCRVATLLAALFCATYNLRAHADAVTPLTWSVAVTWLTAVICVSIYFAAVYVLFGRARRGTAMTLQHDAIDALRAAIPRTDAGATEMADGLEPVAEVGRPSTSQRRPTVHPTWWLYR